MSDRQESEKRGWSRTRKWVTGIVIALLLLLVAVRWLIQSDLLFNYLKGLAEEQASAMLNGTLTIDRLDGDLWHTLEVTGLQLQDDRGQTLLTTDTLRASWSLLDLIRSPHELNQLAIAGLQVHAEQDTSGNWNLLDLLPEADEEEPAEAGPLPSWYIHSIELDRIAATVRSPMLPDRFLSVEDLLIHGEAGYLDEQWAVSVNQFQFLLNEGRLEEPIAFGAVATAEDGQITLEQLLIRTGRSVLRSQVEIEGEEQVTGDLQLSPLSWRDIAAYTDLPLEQDLSARLSLSGWMDDLRIGLELEAAGMEQLMMEAGLILGSQPTLHSFTAALLNLDGPLLSGDPEMPVIDRLDFSGTGEITPEQLEEGHFEGELTLEGVAMSGYELERSALQYSWNRQQADLHLSLVHQDQMADASVQVEDLFEELPRWDLRMTGRQLNLAQLLNDPEMESLLNLDLVAKGAGFELSEERITAELSLEESHWVGVPLDQAELAAELTATELVADLRARLNESGLVAAITAESWQSTPRYRFSASTEQLSLTDIMGEEGLPSDLNLTIEGEGSGIDPETLTLAASLLLTPGHLNNEPIERLEAQLRIEEGVATVTDGDLVSRIAEAQFSFRQHLSDITHSDNRLNLEVTLGDISSLAPLLDVEILEAKGSFVGNLSPRSGGALQFDGNLNLQEIRYDTLLTAEEIVGDISLQLLDEPVVDLDILISGPEYDEYTFQLVELSTRSTLHGDSLTTGSISVGIIQDEERALHHNGHFSYSDPELLVTTHEVQFQTPDRTLSLQRPFDLSWRDQVLQMEPLHLESPEGTAWLELTIPWLDETRQEVELSANRLDVGTIQRLILEDAVVEALFTAELTLQRDADRLESEGFLLFEQIASNEGQLDSLRLDMQLTEGRLTAHAGVWHESREILTLNGDLPFVPDLGVSDGDTMAPVVPGVPLSDQPVRIELALAPTPISFWLQFAEEMEMEMETDGALSFHSTIEGTAGNPRFTGQMELLDGNLSGIAVNLAEVLFNYNHEDGTLQLDGAVHSQGSRIAAMESLLPFRLDLETPAVVMPESSDPLSATVSTVNLNLAMFNDFLDDALARDLRGQINGSFEVGGTFGNPEPSGQIEIVDGRVRIVPVSVNLSNIASTVTMDAGQIRLEALSMRSGPGRLTAEGHITLEELQPNLLQIDLNAEQFQVANTADMNAIIDLQSTMHGSMESPVLAGSLTIRSGFFTLQNFGETSVEDVQLEDEEEVESSALYDSLSVDMSVTFNEQFYIRNRQYLEMEVELDGTVDLVKQPNSELELFGSIEGVRGYAQPLGRNFDLEEAVVSFFGPIANPELTIRTTYVPPQADEEVTLWYIIEGTVEDPNFRFESEPELELQDIFSYTLFGRPFYALESWQQAVSGGGGGGGGVTDVAIDLLLDRVELLASQQLGIDVVQVETNRRGSSNTTTIKTGWYLSNRAFFAMLNEIGGRSPRTLFTLEYMLTPTLELILTQGNDNREGVDLIWNYDY